MYYDTVRGDAFRTSMLILTIYILYEFRYFAFI